MTVRQHGFLAPPFEALEQADFRRPEHAASLKGLLRPFKGKRELEHWASQCDGMRDDLIRLGEEQLSQATAYPLAYLPFGWRSRRPGPAPSAALAQGGLFGDEGLAVGGLVNHPTTPAPLLPQLLDLELQRIALNMQISLTHSLARQAIECAAKMAQAEAIYQRRVDRHTPRNAKEPPPEYAFL